MFSSIQSARNSVCSQVTPPLHPKQDNNRRMTIEEWLFCFSKFSSHPHSTHIKQEKSNSTLKLSDWQKGVYILFKIRQAFRTRRQNGIETKCILNSPMSCILYVWCFCPEVFVCFILATPVTPCAPLIWYLKFYIPCPLPTVPNRTSKCLINDAKLLASNFAVLVIDDCIKRGRNTVISNPHTSLKSNWIAKYSYTSFSVLLSSSIPLRSSQKFLYSQMTLYPLQVTKRH